MKKALITVNAISDYTPAAYPMLFARYGDKGLKDIQKHDKDAASIIANLGRADVVYVGFSEGKSNYPDAIASFVDCENGERFYVINRKIQK